MKVDDQRSAALSHIAKLIDGIPIAMLATVEPVAMGEHGSFDHLSDGAAHTGVKS